MDFPWYKLRAYKEIRENLLGQLYIRNGKGEFLLDDKTLPGDLAHRRLHMPKEKLYPLKQRVENLSQLIRHRTGTKFITNTGRIVKYKKSSKLYTVESRSILKVDTKIDSHMSIITVENTSSRFKVPFNVDIRNYKYASIMLTDNGPILYDLTIEPHKPFKRKIWRKQ